MAKAYFSRRKDFFLLSPEDIGSEEGFDAYPVEVDEVALANIRSVRKLLEQMYESFQNNSAPEECAQQEADMFVDGVRRIFKTRAQDNLRRNDED